MISRKAYERKKHQLINELTTAKSKGAIALQKSTSNLFRFREQRSTKIDVRDFTHVISVDPENLILDVQVFPWRLATHNVGNPMDGFWRLLL